MSGKVVTGGDIFFKDDIKIIETEIEEPLKIPTPLPIFDLDEQKIIYNNHLFQLTDKPKTNDFVQVYFKRYWLVENSKPKDLEDAYMQKHLNQIQNLKEDFIERVINGTSIMGEKATITNSFIGKQISQELIEKISSSYSTFTSSIVHEKLPGKGDISRLNDKSVFGEYLKNCSRVMIFDDKMYQLETIPEYLQKFKSSFEPKFYQSLGKMVKNTTPEEIYKFLSDNSELVHEKALPLVKSKIWHSKESFQLFMDGTYWLPTYIDNLTNIQNDYQKLLERKMKLDAVKEYI
ncbi:MAG: hypothetical protein ABIC91_03635 [Nanoarchaeota archaeon]|nr:hypothetical protein [Nanoarchaeota archaeon]MBU1031172.1 hypothetical protein [Nanoarchaeota archaeon]MBU1849671.1 hypothetical protein [Nanoarchaeota archaeon]